MPIVTQPRGPDARSVARVHRGRLELGRLSPEGWLVLGLTVVAALLRFGSLTSQSFWVDEASTVHEVGLSLGGMFHAISQNESTPPLYFLVAWGWTRLFGAGELGLRSLSALAGTAVIPVAYLCGRELASRRAGLVAAALTTFSPFLIWYSQEGRSYMLFALLGALSLLFWARCLHKRAPTDLTMWAACSALTVLTHFFAGFLVAPEALWLLWRVRGRAALLAVSVVAAVQLAMLPWVIGDSSHPLLSWLRLFPLSVRLRQIPTDFAVSQLYKSPALTWGLPGSAILLVTVTILLWSGGRRSARNGALHAGAIAAFILLAPVGLAEIGHDYVFSRNFVAAWVPVSIVIGAACTAGQRVRFAGMGLVAVLIAGFVWTSVKIAGEPAYQRPDWRGVAAALGPALSPRAVVALSGNAAEEPLSVYLPRTQFSYSGLPASEAPVSVSEIDVVGDPLEAVVPELPTGAHLLGTRIVAGALVARFRLAPAWHLPPLSIAERASRLVSPGPAERPAVLVQPTPSAG